jgi:Uma2 family endonuclease
VLLEDVPWQTYSRLVRAFDGRRSIRLTYDRGALEIMTISVEHENHGWFMGRLVLTLTEELGLPVMGGGSATFRSRRKLRGLEPDNCFWITSEPRVRGKRKIDLDVDPPPDLAIEIDVTRSSLSRLDIYAALGVPEVWRFDGEDLTIHLLGPDGEYREIASSPTFPGIKPRDLVRFMNMRFRTEENSVIRQFRTWVRERIATSEK